LHLIHQPPHQEDAAAADAQFPGLHMWYTTDIEALAFIEKTNLQAFFEWNDLYLNQGLWPANVGMPHDILQRLMCGNLDGFAEWRVEIQYPADRFDKMTHGGQQPKITGNRKCERYTISRHLSSSARERGPRHSLQNLRDQLGVAQVAFRRNWSTRMSASRVGSGIR